MGGKTEPPISAKFSKAEPFPVNDPISSIARLKTVGNIIDRTKERLYAKVIEHLFERILNEPFKLSGEETAETAWFFSTEFYNNKMLFEKAVFSIYGNDALKKISKIRNWLGSAGFVNAVQ